MPLPRKHFRTIDTITDERRERLLHVLRGRQKDVTIVLENIWDPHNVSAILRTADATGIDDVHLLYHIEPFPDLTKKGKQSSASAKKWLTLHHHTSVEDCFAVLRAQGKRIYASHLTKEAVSLHSLDATQPIALVLGNESRGVSDEACALADGVYHIPMAGMVQSLNVSVAAAVSVYEMYRQRLAAGLCDVPSLSEEVIAARLEEWARM